MAMRTSFFFAASLGLGILACIASADQPTTQPARRAQHPAKPCPYDEQEVTLQSPAGHVRLAGTLTLPRSKGPHPAVVLITGFGAQDRDETIGPLKPFLVLADHLTRRGIAVLRMDDRGVGDSQGNLMGSSHEDFLADALAGVEYLKTRKEIDPKRIGLAGHSEGGIISAMAAAKSSDIAFIVLLASPGVATERIIIHQNELLLAKEPQAKREKEMAGVRRFIEVVKGGGEPAELQKKLREFVSSKEPRPSEQEIESEVRMCSTKWIHDYVASDIQPFLKQVRCPVLAINGDKDSLVPGEWNLAGIEQSLKAGGNRNCRIHLMPNVNHFLQSSTTESLEEGFKLPEDVSPEILKIVGEWVEKQRKGGE